MNLLFLKSRYQYLCISTTISLLFYQVDLNNKCVNQEIIYFILLYGDSALKIQAKYMTIKSLSIYGLIPILSTIQEMTMKNNLYSYEAYPNISI